MVRLFSAEPERFIISPAGPCCHRPDSRRRSVKGTLTELFTRLAMCGLVRSRLQDLKLSLKFHTCFEHKPTLGVFHPEAFSRSPYSELPLQTTSAHAMDRI